MKKIGLIVSLLLCCTAFSAYAQMTDDQVMEYVRNAIASGKNETTIGQELLVMGVTTEQIMRVKNNYQEQTGGSLNRNDPAFGEDEGYTRGVSEAASTTQTWEATNSTRQDRRSRRLSVTDKNRDLSSFELMKGALNPSGSEEENSSEESD